MQISISENNVNFTPVEINTLQDFVDYATKYNYSTGTFKNNYRTKNNFILAEAIALDIDNDEPEDNYTIEDAIVKFKDYKHIIMPSKSHKKEKNGKTADRFRVILFLETPINNDKDFTATWNELLNFYPAADMACKDASRFYYPSPEAVSINEQGKLWPVTKYVAPEKTELDFALEQNPERGQLSKSTMHFLTYGAPQGKRNQRLFRAAKDMQEQGFTVEECKARVTAMIQLTGNWGTTYLNDKDLEAINNAYKNVPMYNKREGEATKRSVFNFQTIDEMIKDAGNVDWLVNGMLSVGGFSIIAGPPKTGKSTLVRQLVKTVCQGGSFLEREVKPGPVLYLTFEEQPSVLKEQFNLVGITSKDQIMIHTGAVYDERALEDLEDAIYDFSPVLVVLDTLFDISQLEEINSYKAVKDALSRIRQIARNTDAHIMGVHHTNKLGQFLGSMAIYGAVDTMITFKNFKDQRFISTTGKHGEFLDDREVIYNPANMCYTLGKEYERKVDKL